VRRAALGALLATQPGLAWAHGENPRVTAILFPAPLQGEPLLVTDTQGVFGYFHGEARWLCEDAVAPSAAFVGIAATAATGAWVVASQAGVYRSTDDACTFERATGLPPEVVPVALSPHPQRPDELALLAGGDPEVLRFGVYRSLDGGRTFGAPDILVDTPLHSLLRDPERPERLYLSGEAGAYRSDDAGATWAPFEVGLPDEVITPGAVYFLTVRPGAGEVWAAVQRVPDTLLIRSADRGENLASRHEPARSRRPARLRLHRPAGPGVDPVRHGLTQRRTGDLVGRRTRARTGFRVSDARAHRRERRPLRLRGRLPGRALDTGAQRRLRPHLAARADRVPDGDPSLGLRCRDQRRHGLRGRVSGTDARRDV
jgi:hypothetical protein